MNININVNEMNNRYMFFFLFFINFKWEFPVIGNLLFMLLQLLWFIYYYYYYFYYYYYCAFVDTIFPLSHLLEYYMGNIVEKMLKYCVTCPKAVLIDKIVCFSITCPCLIVFSAITVQIHFSFSFQALFILKISLIFRLDCPKMSETNWC